MRRLTLTATLEYYDVPQILTAADATGTRYLCTLYEQPADLTEAMLPETGYYYDAADLTEEAAPDTDTYQLEVPARDRITFSTLIARMGWPALSLRKTIGKVAAL